MRDRSMIKFREDITTKLISAFKKLISEGTMAPGQRLPGERELAESFGVSRSSLRPALKVLESMGVISQRVGDGTYLNAEAASILQEPLEFLILLYGISAQELMDARLIVEPELTARAARNMRENDLVEVRRALEGMDKARSDRAEFVRCDARFHQAIMRGAGNRVCTLMFAVVHQAMESLMQVTAQMVRPEYTLTLHRRIYAALRKRDAELARRRMIEHLQDARQLVSLASCKLVQKRLQEGINRISTRPAKRSKTAAARAR